MRRSGRSWGVKLGVFLALLVISAAVYYFYFNNTAAQGVNKEVAKTRPAPSVEGQTLTVQPIRFESTFSGRIVPVDSVVIQPLVKGEIQKVSFSDGEKVKKGDLLFLIDPRPYQEKLKWAEAQLASTQSRLTLAKDQLERAKTLVKKRLVSNSEFDKANNEYTVTRAAIAEVKSVVRQARLDLNYCYIKAPFDGRMSQVMLTAGNMVDGASVLAVLVADAQFYAEFDVDEKTYISVQRSTDDITSLPVKMTLAAGDDIVYSGTLHSFDNQINSSSGTIKTRAIFDNTDDILVPGMYAKIQLGTAQAVPTLLIKQTAIGTNQDRKFAYVIEDNIVRYRELVLGDYYGEQRVVLQGVEEGEQVVMKGLSHIRPNMEVRIKQSESTLPSR